tara:strand:- start:5505 stop:7775 length:2271 start_codon:yes stop_codon:yes gene_type:complete
MRKLSLKLINLRYIIYSFFIILFISLPTLSNEVTFEINGNDFTDSDVILSLLDDIPEDINNEYSNEILKALNVSNLFSDVSVNFINNKYIITVKEFPNINKIYFRNNDRLKNEDLELIASEFNLRNFNTKSINLFINETKKLYQSFGYNSVKIDYYEKIYQESNTVDLTFNISEGNITKIDKIIISGNNSISNQDIREIIKSKTKSIRNIFANNNYKPAVVERDKFLITKYFQNNGFIDVNVETQIEFLKSNKVNIYFNIYEGEQYTISSIKFTDEKSILSNEIIDIINTQIVNFTNNNKIFSVDKINDLKKNIASTIISSGNDFFEIKTTDDLINNEISILFKINPVSPKYANQINIVGNSRTFDHVIRKELSVVEGDAVHQTQLQGIRDNLVSLNLFEKVNVKEEVLDDELINIIIEVEEKQTGTFNAGVSVGTLDGFSIVTGLRERNFYGTGRSLEVLLNTSEDKNQFKLVTTNRLSYENDSDISYKLNYKQQDFSKASSYKLDTFSSGIGIGYKLNKKLIHNIDLEYVLKNYKITNSNTASSSIINSSGENMSYLIKNNLRYSTLNSGFIPNKGNYINFNNTIETPTSSSNGFIRNLITFKQFYSMKDNIFSVQTKLGNIISLNNRDILTDDKFSLGGRWLRGFDNFGVGPRNSRSSYVGGNNIAVTKIDYSYEITSGTDFPIYLNFFNDYGLIWENKTKPTKSDNSLRSSFGLGIKYYSPIGPIGFTWGFPIMDEEYDIKRMFLFSVGNID